MDLDLDEFLGLEFHLGFYADLISKKIKKSFENSNNKEFPIWGYNTILSSTLNQIKNPNLKD